MLIQFSVENFRVFRDSQTFSMVANSYSTRNKSDRLVATGWTAFPYVHRQASIFGANGAGKTSLIEAMAFLKKVVRNSVLDLASETIEIQPFLYDHQSRKKPSKFEIIFILNDFLYEYGFSVSKERVEEEWLGARPRSTGRLRQLFIREYNQSTDDYEWYINPAHLKGERDSWKSQTRPTSLFLTTGAQLNNQTLFNVYRWITRELCFMSLSSLNSKNYTAEHLYDTDWKAKLLDFFDLLDLRIDDVNVETLDSLVGSAFPRLKSRERYEINVIRNDNRNHPIFLPLQEESYGTTTLFNLAWPLLFSLEKGRTLILDEMDTSLHPLIFQKIISLFNDEYLNKNCGQLIFSTHDVTSSEIECLNQDQIWMIEKGNDLSSTLRSSSDYKIPPDSNFRRDYMLGRYGAVPKTT